MDRFISHYRVLECLGTGGAGEVFKAEDVRLGRIVALKLLAGPADGVLDEARAAASLNHPNIATVYDVGQEDGYAYIALEFVDGETLGARLLRGPLDVLDAVDIGLDAARALDAAHMQGLVHGDVSASNIVLGVDGRAKVLDFGLSQHSGRAAQASGTPGYVAPELLGGATVDGRVDVFSLGVVLYEMVAGRRPFAGDGWRRALLESEPSPLSASREDVPLELERIVRRALERDPDVRYPSAAALAADLERLRTNLEPERILTVQPRPSGIAAFRGLLPFHESDRNSFFGRDAETASLLSMVTHADFRFGVLYGDSGTGKTSLLRAGVMPALWEAGFAPILTRLHHAPLETLVAECQRATGIAAKSTESLAEYLARIAETLDAPLIVIFDQFEEFFVSFKSEESREAFLDALAALHANTRLRVRFLVSIRSDFLHFIGSEVSSRVPEPLATARLFHLRAFDEAAAVEILERSAGQADLPFEGNLSRHIARDLVADGNVLPSELQIIGERLQCRRIFSVREYRRAGGKELLVFSFLEDVIRASGDREAASLLLRCLISDENTRLTLSTDEIVRRTQRPRETVLRLVKRFAEARLIREIQEEQPWRYELVHEYLVDKINRVTGHVFDVTQRANRLFRQYASSYAVDPRTRVPLGKLLFIRRNMDREVGDRDRELLRKSLRAGVARAVALVVLVALVGVATAAAFSVEETWEGVRLRDGHTSAARRAVFTPDGRLLLTCGEDNRAIVWDFARRQRLATLDGHTDWVTTAAVSPDGSVFVTGGEDGRVIVWDAHRFDRIVDLSPPDENRAIMSLAFSPDGRRLVAVSDSESAGATVWSTASWSAERSLPGLLTSWANPIFLEDGAFLSHNGVLWKLADGTTDRPDPLLELEWNWAAFSPDGTKLVTIAGDGEVRFVDLALRSKVARKQVHHDHGRAAAFSPDGRIAATGAEDIVLWDAATATKLARLQHTAIVWCVTFSPDGRWIVSSHGDGSILVWDAAERERVANLNEHCAPVRGVAFSPDGRLVVTTSEDRSAIVWDLETGRKQTTLVGHATRVAAAAFSPDGTEIATADQNDNLFLWDAASGDLVRQVRAPPSQSWRSGYCVAYSPDGRFIVLSDYVVDRSTGVVVSDFFTGADDSANYYAVAFVPARPVMVGLSPARSLLDLRETSGWAIARRTLQPEKTSFVTLGVAPDGRTIVTGDDEGRVLQWDAESFEPRGELGRHSARVKSVAFSPDGTQVASCGDDQTIALWDIRSGTRVATVGTHAAPVLAIAYSPDGRLIVAGGHDDSVRVYTRHRRLWGYSLDGDG